jgi:hypothetical protein
MNGFLSKQQIIEELDKTSEEFTAFCNTIDDQSFFKQPANKWSVAENVKHLIISTSRTRLAFVLPKFILRSYVGRPNRSSRSFDELLTKYNLKLLQGGRASGVFIPKKVSSQQNKQQWLFTFSKAMSKLGNSIQKKWKDEQLDKYIAPHPLLGKITLRELCYFTIFHTQHHLNTIKERLTEFRTLP